MLLDQNTTFTYSDYGKENFGLALLPNVLSENSKFYDSQTDMCILEVFYDIKEPSFSEFVA